MRMMLVLFSLVTMMNSAHGGGWISQGSPMPPPIDPSYEYSYLCKAEVSDRKGQRSPEGFYLVLATAEFRMNNQTKSILGKDLTWKSMRLHDNIERSPHDRPHGFDLDRYFVNLYINAVSSDRDKTNKTLRGADRVNLRIGIANLFGSAITTYAKDTQVSYSNKSVHLQVRSNVKSAETDRSMSMEMHPKTAS